MATLGRCDKPTAINEQINKYIAVFRKLIVDGGAEMQEVLMACMERHIRSNFNMLKHTPVIMKLFYDADLLEEDTVLVWADSRTRGEFSYAVVEDTAITYIKQKAKPFVTWLKNAASEDDGEEGMYI
jgi:hypothetical protein